MIKECLCCGDRYNAKKSKQKYCSLDCRVLFNRGLSNEKPKRYCLGCGDSLIVRQNKYCSRDCRYKYEEENIYLFSEFYKKRCVKNIGREKAKRKLSICPECGIEFRHLASENRKFCSTNCSGKQTANWMNLKRKNRETEYRTKNNNLNFSRFLFCKNCKKSYKKTGNRKRKFCSRKCTIDYKISFPEEYKQMYEIIHKKLLDNIASGKLDEVFKKTSDRMKKKNPSHDPKVVEKQKASMIKYYEKNPDKLKERLRNFMLAPIRGRGKEDRNLTKLEKFVVSIGSKKVRYTGNGRFWLSFKNKKKKNPDFKVNGKRKVIEVGDTQYWHSLEEIKDTVNQYALIGYECLYLTDVDIYESPEESKIRILKLIEDGEER